jgi:hypothetical protein
VRLVLVTDPSQVSVRGSERGTQRENSYTKPAITNRIPATATLGIVNEASRSNDLKSYDQRTTKHSQMIVQKEMKGEAFVAEHKNKKLRYRRLQAGYKFGIHDVHTYIIG